MPSYLTPPIDTLNKRRIAYERLASLLLHLHNLNINLLSLVRNPDATVTITTNNPLPLQVVDKNALELVEV